MSPPVIDRQVLYPSIEQSARDVENAFISFCAYDTIRSSTWQPGSETVFRTPSVCADFQTSDFAWSSGKNENLGCSEAVPVPRKSETIGRWWYSSLKFLRISINNNRISCTANRRPGHALGPIPNGPVEVNLTTQIVWVKTSDATL